MWYSTDAARRRYLRRLALQDTVEHAPMWELATDWAYSPTTILTGDGCAIAMGFGNSIVEAMDAAKICIEHRDQLESDKRQNLSRLLDRGRFTTGHKQTDRAYGHVLAKVIDCLAIEGWHQTHHLRPMTPPGFWPEMHIFRSHGTEMRTSR